MSVQGVLNICPGSDDGAKDHETKREQGHTRHDIAKDELLAVGNKDDGQVLEDGIDWNGEISQRFRGCVDHANQEDGNG